MTVVFGLLTVGAIFLLRDDERAWIAVPIALLIGLWIFVNDVNFSADLGLQW